MIALEVGKIYQNGRGDYFGPMENPAFDLWLDQYNEAYKANGQMHGHTHDSQSNLIAEADVSEVCNAHNESEAARVMFRDKYIAAEAELAIAKQDYIALEREAFKDYGELETENGGLHILVKAAEAELDAAKRALELLYDKWENGLACYEDGDPESGFVGNAFKLTEEEENQILALIPALPNNPAVCEGEVG